MYDVCIMHVYMYDACMMYDVCMHMCVRMHAYMYVCTGYVCTYIHLIYFITSIVMLNLKTDTR